MKSILPLKIRNYFSKPIIIEFSKRKFAILLTAVFSIFFMSIYGVALLKNTDLLSSVFFDSYGNYSFVLYVLEIISFFFGAVVVFLLPGFIWVSVFIKQKIDVFYMVVYSFIISTVTAIIFTSVFKIIFKRALTTINFLQILFFIIGIGILLLLKKKEMSLKDMHIDKRALAVVLLIIAIFICSFWIFQEKTIWVEFDKDYSQSHILSIPLGEQGDIQEQFGRIDSLHIRLWPYWDLEYVNKFGYLVIDPPLFLFICYLLVLLYGQAYGVLSVGNAILILVCVGIIWSIAKLGIKINSRALSLFAFLALVLSYIYTILMDKHPHDLFIAMSFLMSALVLTQFYCLLSRKTALFLLCAVLSFLTKYEAAFFTITGLLFYGLVFKPNRRAVVKLSVMYTLLVMLYLMLLAIMGMCTHNTQVYLESFFVEKFARVDIFHLLDKYFLGATIGWEKFSLYKSLLFLKRFMIATLFSGLLIFLPSKDKITRFFSMVAMAYFFVVFFGRYNRLHYMTPLIFISMVVAVRTVLLYKQKTFMQRR